MTVLAAQRESYDELRRRARAAVLALRDEADYPELLERLAAAARRDLGDDAQLRDRPARSRRRARHGRAPARSTTRWRRWPTAASTTSARGSRRCGRDGAHRDPRQRAGRRDRRAWAQRVCSSSSRSAPSGWPARSSRCAATRAVVQLHEYTGGLGPGAPASLGGGPLTAELGPGLLGGIFDGMLRRLEDLGERLAPGARAPTLSRDRRWRFTPARARGRWRRRRCRARERPRDRGDRGAGAGAAGRRRHRRVAGGRGRVHGGRADREDRRARRCASPTRGRCDDRGPAACASTPRSRSAPASARSTCSSPSREGRRRRFPAASAPARRCCCSRSPSGRTPT